MTKLEEEIFGEFYGWAVVTDDEGQPVDFYALKVHYANIAAEVAKKYIEKALDGAYCAGAADGSIAAKTRDYNNIGSHSYSQKWLKENGVI